MSAPPLLPKHLYGVLGWPLAQSLSPLLHNTAFQVLGMDSVYLRWEIAPEKLSAFVESVRILPISGCSVTIPHKVAIVPFLDRVSRQATLAGAVNTLYWEGETLCGDNTDVSGFLAPLCHMPLQDMSVLLLGAGGAARAAAAGLQLRGCRQVWICTPSDKSHLSLAEEFGFTPLLWADRHRVQANLLINTTPLGMRGKHEGVSPYDFSLSSWESRGAVAYDIVYNPLTTRFLCDAGAAGLHCISGLEMFYGQASAQFQLWTGLLFPTVVRQELEKALGCGPAKK